MCGSDVLKLGIPEGPLVGEALRKADELGRQGYTDVSIRMKLKQLFGFTPAPKLEMSERPLLTRIAMPLSHGTVESLNKGKCVENMDMMLRVPVVKAGALMPDACPAGGGITVGGVIEVENAIIPSAHSADICCSMNTSFFRSELNAKQILDCVVANTHFGPGGRPYGVGMDFRFPANNKFLNGLEKLANTHMGTQGDGNHFASLGRFKITSEFADAVGHDAPVGSTVWALTTHHGSRGFGAEVFKRGQKAAVKYTNTVANSIPSYAAWLSMDTQEGKDYWEALQTVLNWTIQNHRYIHKTALEAVKAQVVGHVFNEHNFIWKKESEAPWDAPIYIHGKGATPAWDGALGIIPLNMAEPILVVVGKGNKFLDFAPHGAGRNESRTAVSKKFAHLGDSRGLSQRDAEEIVRKQTEGLDIRWFNGRPDITESPLAYKGADYIRGAINEYGLCDILGEIQPVGCCMAGYSEPHWKKGKRNDRLRTNPIQEEGGEEGNQAEAQGESETLEAISERGNGEAFN